MNTDFRIEVGFFSHHKTLRLIRRLGLAGPWSLLQLWQFAATSKPDGRLDGMTAEDLAAVARWEGDALAFVGDLEECGFLDNVRGAWKLHDWKEHQPHVVAAPARREKARRAALTRWGSPDSSNASSSAAGHSAEDAPSMPAAVPHPTFLPTNPQNPPLSPTETSPPSRGEQERALPGVTVDRSRPEVDAFVAVTGHRATPATYRAAQRLVAAGRLPELVAARERYAAEVQVRDTAREYRIRPHNWFGRDQRWLEFHGEALEPARKPSPGAAKGDRAAYERTPRWD